MDLRQRFVHAATARPHVFLVPVPGCSSLRQAVQSSLDAYGWPTASSPAQADLLVECGVPGPELTSRVDSCWQAMPGPRARVRVTAVDEVEVVLLAGRAALRDDEVQQRDAGGRVAPPADMDMSEMDHGSMDMGMAGMAEDDMAGMADSGMDMGGMDHGGMDMGGMDMDIPGGLTMAGRLEDRDGLRLEGLHLRLGPLLPGWPAGIELQVTLSGDVITHATAVRLDGAMHDTEDADPRDALALLLSAAGWQDGAALARRAGPASADMARRLRRARLLRWSLRGLPAPGGRDLVAHLDALAVGAALPPCTLADLARAVTGLELDAVGLVVAAYGPALTRHVAHV